LKFKINWDALGIGATIACAIHCAVLPALVVSLPVFGIDFVKNVGFEYFMIFLALSIGVFSLWHGYKKHHHSFTPLILFVAGILFLFAKQIWHNYEITLLIPAVILIVWAHYTNYKLCQKANHCHTTDCAH
jgi:hypothetical protein